jgi:hypothetical protein
MLKLDEPYARDNMQRRDFCESVGDRLLDAPLPSEISPNLHR